MSYSVIGIAGGENFNSSLNKNQCNKKKDRKKENLEGILFEGQGKSGKSFKESGNSKNLESGKSNKSQEIGK